MYKKFLLAVFGGMLSACVIATGARAEVINTGPLSIEYEGSGPVFSQPNIAPGGEFVKTLSITNNGSVNHSFAMATTNINGDLGDSIRLAPKIHGVEVWAMTITELSNIPEQSKTVVPLILPDETVSVDLIARFDSSSGNDLQGKQINFDFIFGTQEAEPSVGADSGTTGTGGATFTTLEGGLLGVSAPTPEGLASAVGSPTTTADDGGEVLGAQDTQNGEPWQGLNGLLLLIPAGILLLSVPFVSPSARNAVLPTLGAVAAAVLSFFIKGNMPRNIFWAILIAEVVLILVLDYFIVKNTVIEVLEEEVPEKKARRAKANKKR